MKIFYRVRPGAGFVILSAVILASASFFAWGMRTPPLQRAWQTQIELNVGHRNALGDHELRLFQEVLVRHPAIADNMLENSPTGLISANVMGLVENGYAYLVRKSRDAPGVLEVTPAGTAVNRLVHLSVRVGTGGSHTGKATRDAPFSTTLSQRGPFPQLIEVRVDAGDKKRPPPVVVRLKKAS